MGSGKLIYAWRKGESELLQIGVKSESRKSHQSGFGQVQLCAAAKYATEIGARDQQGQVLKIGFCAADFKA